MFTEGYGVTKGGAETVNKAGYAFVSQGVRKGPDPHGISGNARFFADDVDGYDTIEWLARQPWCDGKVATFGPSYWGATQWLAAAIGDPGPPPHLKAIIASVINPDFWERAELPVTTFYTFLRQFWSFRCDLRAAVVMMDS